MATKATAQRDVQWVPLSKLIPDPKNARTHSKTQLHQLASSIREFGWTNPILVDKKWNLIAGHGRSEAAKLKPVGKKWEPMNAAEIKAVKVPVIVLGDLTEAQVKALRIADNKLGDNSGWDQILLREALAELSEMDFDMDVIGFSDADMKRMLDEAGQMQTASAEDVAPRLDGIRYRILIECESEAQQATEIEKLEAQGYSCQPLMS